MKVRWTRESLRLRITPGELAALRRGEAVHEALTLPGGIRWAVELDPTAPRPGLACADGVARVGLGPEHLRRLSAPDAEGVYPHLPELRLMVEKDFPCAHPHAPGAMEPESERFAPSPGFLARKGVA
jgi:hypothetical protein